MESKIMTMKEAVSKFVNSGDLLFLSGMQHGEPSAAVHEIVRQKIDHLTLVCCLGFVNRSLPVGEGLVDKMIIGHMQLDDKTNYYVAKAKSMNKLPVLEEYSHFGIALALMAGQMGVPFLPTRCQIGSDMPTYNSNIRTIDCPFTGEKLGIVRAVVPDVGIIHVQRADAEGNAQKWGTLGVDQEGVNASRKVIVTTEKIVAPEVIRRDPNRTIVPGFRVNAIVEQPWGALPSHLAGCYSGDSAGFMAEIRKQEDYEAYLENFVYGVKDWDEYIKKRIAMKGENYFDRFRMVNPTIADPIITSY